MDLLTASEVQDFIAHEMDASIQRIKMISEARNDQLSFSCLCQYIKNLYGDNPPLEIIDLMRNEARALIERYSHFR